MYFGAEFDRERKDVSEHTKRNVILEKNIISSFRKKFSKIRSKSPFFDGNLLWRRTELCVSICFHQDLFRSQF